MSMVKAADFYYRTVPIRLCINYIQFTHIENYINLSHKWRNNSL